MPHAHAGFWSGEKLFGILEKIQSNNYGYNSGLDAGYITGTLDQGFGIAFCPPAGKGALTVELAMQIAYNYM